MTRYEYLQNKLNKLKLQFYRRKLNDSAVIFWQQIINKFEFMLENMTIEQATETI